MCQPVAQTEIGSAVRVRTPPPLFHLPLPLVYLPLVLSSTFGVKSAKCGTFAGTEMAGGARLPPVGLLLVTAKGKMTFPSLFILGRHQKECRSSCSIPAGRSDPASSASAATLPLLRQGLGWIQRLIRILTTE